MEQRTNSLCTGRLDPIMFLAFPQVRSTFSSGPEILGSLLIPECTITPVIQAIVNDLEECLLNPPLPRLLRSRFVQSRSAVRAEALFLRCDIRSSLVLGRIGHDPQLGPGTPPVRGRHRRHHHSNPGTGHTPAPHLQCPLLDQPVHHPGSLCHGTPQQPRNRRICTVAASRYRPAHEPHSTVRPGSQHQPQQRQPLRGSPSAPSSTKQTHGRLWLAHRRPPRREQRLAQRQQDCQLTLLQHQSLRATPGLSSRQWK
ncbi:hypothetical protein ACN6K4_002928 [Streptomyces hayashii]|uniref:hypothetical protein n=1 Tax=Streptomyces hayashii TaxID=2839966 RepID=UPI00403C6C45